MESTDPTVGLQHPLSPGLLGLPGSVSTLAWELEAMEGANQYMSCC